MCKEIRTSKMSWKLNRIQYKMFYLKYTKIRCIKPVYSIKFYFNPENRIKSYQCKKMNRNKEHTEM